MKMKLGILLLAFLATVGFSGAIAAQHEDEGHTNKHTHGTPRSNIEIIFAKRHYKDRNPHLNWFQN